MAKPFCENGETQHFTIMSYITKGIRPTILDYVPEYYLRLIPADSISATASTGGPWVTSPFE
jgi:hypothetical protein